MPGFLEALRRLCDACGALLVFDEVITGFRVARGGAQARFGVRPDLTILGKIAGGGLPLAAFGGREDVMAQLAPSGAVYQAGTLSGNPLATAAALVVLRRLRDPAVYEELETKSALLESGLGEAARGEDVCVQRVGSMLDHVLPCGPRADVRRRPERGHRALRRLLPPHAASGRVPRAVAVRGGVRLDRARRRRDRPDGRGGTGVLPVVTSSVWDTIAREAAEESPLWAAALRRPRRPRARPDLLASRSESFALVTESIYEGYLLHYGRPRLFAPADADTAVLLGDYLYAHGLVRLAELDDVTAVADFAELISLCTQARAEASYLGAGRSRMGGHRGAGRDLGRAALDEHEWRCVATAIRSPCATLAQASAGREPVATGRFALTTDGRVD